MRVIAPCCASPALGRRQGIFFLLPSPPIVLIHRPCEIKWLIVFSDPYHCFPLWGPEIDFPCLWQVQLMSVPYSPLPEVCRRASNRYEGNGIQAAPVSVQSTRTCRFPPILTLKISRVITKYSSCCTKCMCSAFAVGLTSHSDSTRKGTLAVRLMTVSCLVV